MRMELSTTVVLMASPLITTGTSAILDPGIKIVLNNRLKMGKQDL